MSKSGFVNILLVLAVIVLAILLSGGISPKKQLPPNENAKEGIIDQSSLPIPGSKKSLQLGTFKFKECAGTITLDLLLDRSGSMNRDTPQGVKKIERLKEAVLALTSRLSDDSIIGIQSFSAPQGQDSIRADIPIGYYKDVGTQIPNAVSALQANGSTPTHNALAFSRDRLAEAIPNFPNRKFNFILISDGKPVPDEQDPRLFNPNPADQIKALGVTIYTLGIYDLNQLDKPQLAELLKSIASKPENYFSAETADDTTKLLSAITDRICQ